MGGDAAALEDALALAQADACASVTLLHRIDKFRVEPALEQALRTALAQGQLQLVIGQPTGLECEGEHLTALELATNDGSARLPLDALLPRLGLSPKLGPVADWGLAMERKQLFVSPETFATSEPGIFAVGDIDTYPGKRKLIVCGFHEATLAAFAAAAVVRPEERVLLQYATSSPRCTPCWACRKSLTNRLRRAWAHQHTRQHIRARLVQRVSMIANKKTPHIGDGLDDVTRKTRVQPFLHIFSQSLCRDSKHRHPRRGLVALKLLQHRIAPSMSGILMSSKIKSGTWRSANSMPCRALCAVHTS